jgi:trehalose/maltose transport system substrate-binding protein
VNRSIGNHRISSPRVVMIAGIVILSSLFFSLGGCRPSSSQPVTVTVLDPEWSQPNEQGPGTYQESEHFTRETGIRVNHPSVPESTLAQLGLLRRLLQEGSSPDVLGVDVIWAGSLDQYLVDLRPYFATELASLDPQLVASYTVGGKVVAMPYHPQVAVLAYRTDLLKEYGYTRPPKTWDELESMAARIQTGERAKGKKDFWGYVWQGASGEGLTCNALEWQVSEGGGSIVENDKTITANNPSAIRAWQRAAHWIDWISPPSIVAYRELDAMNTWNSGGAAFWRTWQSAYSLTHRGGPGIEERVGFTSMPGGQSERVGTLGGIALGVSRSSTHPQESMNLIRFLVRRELQSKKDTANANPPDQPAFYELPLMLDPYAHSATTNQQRGGVVVRPSIIVGARYEDFAKSYFEAVHSVLTGEKKAPEAAAALEKQLVEMTGFKTGPPSKGVPLTQ